MNIQVLVSTMNQQDHSLIEKMRITTDAVVVNQCGRDSEEDFEFCGHHVKWINSSTRGLSVSRNICLDHAAADICLIADDDMFYVDGYEKTVKDAFDKNPGCSILRFKAEGIEKPFKNYPDQAQDIHFLDSFKMSSVEIALKRKAVEGIRFDEAIGAGTHFGMGEENAFLTECLRRKLKIRYIPATILKLHIGQSTWYHGMDEQYMISRGAAFEAMKTPVTDLLILQFAVRKYRLYRNSLSLPKAVGLMKKGKKLYRLEKNTNHRG